MLQAVAESIVADGIVEVESEEESVVLLTV